MSFRRFFPFALVAAAVAVLIGAAAFVEDDIITVAGNGGSGFEGDGGLAELAKLDAPNGVAVDLSGNIYIVDTGNYRIRKVDAATGIITTVVGSGTKGFGGDGDDATLAALKTPWDVDVDDAGNLYIADTENHRIRRVDAATGIIETVAGSGAGKYFGDGGGAVGAKIRKPHGVAYDSADNIIIADTENHVVRKVDRATGIINTIGGTGATAGYSGDGGAATAALFDKPHGVAVDGSDHVYVADTNNSVIRRIDAVTGIVTTVAGTGSGGYNGDGILATAAKLKSPEAISLDSSGNLYIVDTGNNRVRKVDAGTGIITTVAGTGGAGYNGDGIAATAAKIDAPKGIWLREATLCGYPTVFGSLDNSKSLQTATKIALADPATVTSITAYVGGRNGDDVRFAIYTDNGGEPDALVLESATDQATAAMAWMTIPVTNTFLAAGTYWLALETSHVQNKYTYDLTGGDTREVANDASTNGFLASWGASSASNNHRVSIHINTEPVVSIYLADSDGNRIRKFADGGNISTVAGDGSSGYAGDGGPATSAEIKKPEGVAVDVAGNIFIADTENHRIRKVDAVTGNISTYAGTGVGGYSGDSEPANTSEVKKPRGIAANAAGDILIADTENHGVREVIAATGFIESVAGSGTPGFDGDGGQGVGASLREPGGVKVMPNGDFYIADSRNHVIRKVVVGTGIITTVAGTPETPGDAGDGGLATAALLNWPYGVAVDELGSIYIADSGNHRIRKVDVSTGIITTIGGKGQAGDTGDGGLATSARIRDPADVNVDEKGHVFFADTGNKRIRMIDKFTGIIDTVAGTGSSGYSGDGGPATLAKISDVWGIALDSKRDLFIADTGNKRIRMVDLPPLSVKVISWQEVDPQ